MCTGSMKGWVGEEVPEEIRDSVGEWLDRVADSPLSASAKRHVTDPNWPVVVHWAQSYPHNSSRGRRIQRGIMQLHSYYMHGGPISVRRVLVARLQRLFAREHQPHLIRPPGGVLLRVGRFLLKQTDFQRYVEPHVADIHHEYFAALAAHERWRAKWIVFRGYMKVLSPLIAGVVSTLKALWRISGA